jgi:putative flavoprotein involved in K+ transport
VSQVDEFDVVVVGAGQAGLGIGYFLQQAGLEFVILERGRIGESWRSQRWDSFSVNTPNRTNGLPGSPYDGSDPDGFVSRDELVASFERHASTHELPIRLGVTVTGAAADASGGFVIDTLDSVGHPDSLRTHNVVVASGMARSPRIPAVSERFPAAIDQLHASDYRSPRALADGAVVVIGSGQSGCQIVEDLLDADRTVYLCTSRVARVPRTYRGRDVIEWMRSVGLMNQRVADLADPAMQFAAQPQVSGVGPRGHTVSLQGLSGRGVRLMGRLSDVSDGVLVTDDGLADHIAFADGFSAEFKRNIDAYIDATGSDAPPPGDDAEDLPASPEVAAAGLTRLDLAGAGVSTVIWCTGFTADFDWLTVPATDDSGRPIHERGVSPVPGVYFLGFPWLHTRKSGIILGIEEDARHVAEAIAARRASGIA